MWSFAREEQWVRGSQHPVLSSGIIKTSLINRITKYGRESHGSKYLAGMCVYSVFSLLSLSLHPRTNMVSLTAHQRQSGR